MKVLLQYWKQRDGNLLISVCRNVESWRELRRILLFAENGEVPEGDCLPAFVSPRAPFLGGLVDGFTFITEAERETYVTFPDP